MPCHHSSPHGQFEGCGLGPCRQEHEQHHHSGKLERLPVAHKIWWRIIKSLSKLPRNKMDHSNYFTYSWQWHTVLRHCVWPNLGLVYPDSSEIKYPPQHEHLRGCQRPHATVWSETVILLEMRINTQPYSIALYICGAVLALSLHPWLSDYTW